MSVCALQYSGGWGHQSQERPVSVRALQYSGGWGRQSQERPVSVCALQYTVVGDVSLKRDQ